MRRVAGWFSRLRTAVGAHEVAACVGVGLVGAGCWMIYPPASLIWFGVAVLAGVWFTLPAGDGK